MKPSNFVIKDKTFGFNWDIYIGGELNTAVKVFCKKLKITPWEKTTNPMGHFFAYEPIKVGGLWFRNDPHAYPGVLAHECCHAAKYVMDCMTTSLAEPTEEFYAYYVQFLVESILLKTR